ncbi:MAG: hypothetical protein ACFFBD_10225 [Candidatus Hodarchaeota archaeon]
MNLTVFDSQNSYLIDGRDLYVNVPGILIPKRYGFPFILRTTNQSEWQQIVSELQAYYNAYLENNDLVINMRREVNVANLLGWGYYLHNITAKYDYRYGWLKYLSCDVNETSCSIGLMGEVYSMVYSRIIIEATELPEPPITTTSSSTPSSQITTTSSSTPSSQITTTSSSTQPSPGFQIQLFLIALSILLICKKRRKKN